MRDPYINSDCDAIFWATICFLRHPNMHVSICVSGTSAKNETKGTTIETPISQLENVQML